MNVGETMARVLWCSVAQQFTSVRGLAREVFRTRHNREPQVKANVPVLNELRGPERAVNRCQQAGLLGSNLRPTHAGLMALARSEIGRSPSSTAISIHFASHAYDGIRPLIFALLELAAHEHEDALTSLWFTYWHGRMYGPLPSDRALARSSLGGKVGSDCRQIALPLAGVAGPGVDPANTGAPPQPPYTCLECGTNNGHHVRSCPDA